METATRIVLLMHPMEWRKEKCTTGRLTCLNLANSEIIQGVAFDGIPRFKQLRDDPRNLPVLLYPGPTAWNLSERGFPPSFLGGRRLVVFLVDSTWACSRSILRASPGLLRLPRLKFNPTRKSRWVIKRQPAAHCLSTLEATHELLIALEEAGLDRYPDKERLLRVFEEMQAYQVERASRDATPRFLSKARRGPTPT